MNSSPRWISYLPNVLQNKIKDSPGVIKVINNISWLFVDKVIRMTIGLFIGVWVARYLGPEQFGLLNFSTAFVSLFGVVAALGLKDIVVRDLVNKPKNANNILGTAFLLQVLSGLLSFTLVIVAINYFRPEDSQSKLIVIILGFIMVFKSSDVIKYWFESQVKSKYTVWAESGVIIFFSAVKVVLILNNSPLINFVWAILLESILLAIVLFLMYGWSGEKLKHWSVQTYRAKKLLNNSWPLILSGLAIIIYLRIDQIMLGQILNNEAVGIYSAAVRISEVWYFIPIIIISSLFPSIINTKKQNEVLYFLRLQKIYDLLIWLAIGVSLPVMFLSDWVVNFLYGEEYKLAGDVLMIHIWAGIFVFFGVARGKWLIIENLQKIGLVCTLIGAMVNIFLNYIFIEKYGVNGAAISTFFSYGVSALIVPLFFAKDRVSTLMFFRSLNLFRYLKLN